MTSDVLKPCKFPSLDSFQKRFLWTHKGVDLAPHPVIGLVLQVGHAEKFPQALCFEGLDPFLRVSKQGSCFTATEEDGGGKRLEELECWMDNIKKWTSLPIPELLTRACCRKDWKRISAESSHMSL